MSACIEYAGKSRDSAGYGRQVNPRTRKLDGAHRIALERKLGRPLLPRMLACHTCDNPPCVNPEHLFEGDHRANALDAVAKGRYRNGQADKTHCKQGHEFTPENTGSVYPVTGRNGRYCKTCKRETGQRKRNKEMAA